LTFGSVPEGLLKVYLPDLKVKKRSLPDIYALTYTKEQFVGMYKSAFTEPVDSMKELTGLI